METFYGYFSESMCSKTGEYLVYEDKDGNFHNITQVSKTELRMPNPFLPDMEFVAKDLVKYVKGVTVTNEQLYNLIKIKTSD